VINMLQNRAESACGEIECCQLATFGGPLTCWEKVCTLSPLPPVSPGFLPLRSRRLHFYGLDFGAVRASSPNPARLLQTAISVDLPRQFVLGKNVSHHDVNLHYAKDEICQRISSITHHAFVIPRQKAAMPPSLVSLGTLAFKYIRSMHSSSRTTCSFWSWARLWVTFMASSGWAFVLQNLE
jgi:hypothetical protein